MIKTGKSAFKVLNMASKNHGNRNDKLEESGGGNAPDEVSLNNSTSRKMLLSDETSRSVASSSPSVLTSPSLRERINGVFGLKIDWSSLLKMSKEWIKDPMNLALFVWVFCVAISGAILFLVMTGMLNAVLPTKSERDVWFEVNNQILNALFTLMCLYQHPKRFYHLILLIRWKPEDVDKLRSIYCKNGTYKPHEWAHMLVVILLLHLNCFAQYALCVLNLGYKRSERPAIGVGITISFSIGTPAVAGLYTILSPLGTEYDSEIDEEAQLQIAAGGDKRLGHSRLKSSPKRYSFSRGNEQNVTESRPLWRGGILDIWEDISIAYLSLFCTFCVFGWNMERLGFGNMYVHIATFILFCSAPFWIFNLAAVNINNETVREALGLTGIILCLFGLLYGGFWRIQMRRRFNLPAYNFCYGKPEVSDCILWLCCCWCSLAQEVRTGNSYNIVEDKFCMKNVEDSNKQADPPSPLQNGDGTRSPFGNTHSPPTFSMANSHGSSKTSKGYDSPDSELFVVQGEPSTESKNILVSPPSPAVMERQTT